MITQARLKELLHYDPDTGVFTWLKRTSYRVKVGETAGNKHLGHNGKHYIIIGIEGKRYRAHRLAYLYINSELPLIDIDHEDGDGSNNKFSNLRLASHKQNHRNKKLPSNNTSGVIGVNFCQQKNKWQAKITTDVKRIHLGFYENIFDAICARKSAEKRYGYHKNHGSVRDL